MKNGGDTRLKDLNLEEITAYSLNIETLATSNPIKKGIPRICLVDDKGNRLGMGKGYYDRTFAFVNDKSATGPELIGLAHECQRVENLEAADWDVPLGGIITGQQFYQVR